MKIFHFLFLIPYFLFSACSVSKQISNQAKILIQDSAINMGHIGISIYEPATNKYWYNYQAEKYFVPASNTKLFSLYAGMKYLGDSLVGLKYVRSKQKSTSKQNYYYIEPTGDPTFLHPDFANQPVADFLKHDSSAIYELDGQKTNFNALGFGWSWDDYLSSDMAERSTFPVYGNLYTFLKNKNNIISIPANLIVEERSYDVVSNFDYRTPKFRIERELTSNILYVNINKGLSDFTKTQLPFITSVRQSLNLIKDTLKAFHGIYQGLFGGEPTTSIIHSQPSDSLFTIMMHRSDNFFAEQTLLMASNEKLGYMSDRKMIDYLLNNDLKDIPQKPKWVDGSGLSRYNLFTPKDFIFILQKLKTEFGLERLKVILPTGGTGTLSSLYKKDSGYIFAKTGTLSNHVALSGFLITKKNKLLIFSILPGNFISSATPVRKAIEKFLSNIRQRY